MPGVVEPPNNPQDDENELQELSAVAFLAVRPATGQTEPEEWWAHGRAFGTGDGASRQFVIVGRPAAEPVELHQCCVADDDEDAALLVDLVVTECATEAGATPQSWTLANGSLSGGDLVRIDSDLSSIAASSATRAPTPPWRFECMRLLGPDDAPGIMRSLNLVPPGLQTECIVVCGRLLVKAAVALSESGADGGP